MELVEDWKAILQKAWSVKFNILAAVFGGLEVAVALVQPEGVRHGVFATVAGVISVVAIGARVMAQKEITNEKPKG